MLDCVRLGDLMVGYATLCEEIKVYVDLTNLGSYNICTNFGRYNETRDNVKTNEVNVR